jgi:hypothetical protein
MKITDSEAAQFEASSVLFPPAEVRLLSSPSGPEPPFIVIELHAMVNRFPIIPWGVLWLVTSCHKGGGGAGSKISYIYVASNF